MGWLAYLDTMIWTALFIIFLIVEISTFNLVTIWFSISSLFNVFLTLFKVNATDIMADGEVIKRSFISPVWQIIIFLVVAIACFVLFYPRLRRWQQKGKVETNVDAMAGKTGIVLKTIKDHSTGQIKVDGQVWTAVSDTKEEIPEGAEVSVLSVNGVKAVVQIKTGQED